MASTKIKAVFFDFMGTCLDWHAGVVKALPQSIPESERSSFALEWRQAYQAANATRLAAGELTEDIDITLRKSLDILARKYPAVEHVLDDETKSRCVTAWHNMSPWPEVRQAVEELKANGYEVFVFGNGTTRLQLDLCQSSELSFDMLFSSELLGVYKPSAESYHKVLQLVRVKPEESAMVAAHAFDTRGARDVGMKTVYVRRWTDDIREDMDVVRGEVNVFLEDMTTLVSAIGRL